MQLTAVRCGVGASYLSFVTAHFMSELVYLDERDLCRVSAPSCFDKNHLAHGGTAVDQMQFQLAYAKKKILSDVWCK